MTEFELIQTYFSHFTPSPYAAQGIGDDAAILNLPAHHSLVVTTDTLISGVHFPEETTAADIAYKALAVNLSDLAAMGATPTWFTLALTLQTADEPWLREFSNSLRDISDQYHLSLIGGDTTRGNTLSITIAAMGLLPVKQGLLRSHAKPGDLIYVTGTLGDAGLALAYLQQKEKTVQDVPYLLQRLNRPTPRVVAGIALLPLAHAAIDLSDGLASDLAHVLQASEVGAIINVSALPCSPAMRASVSLNQAIHYALSAGDDYELCFTIAADKKVAAEKALTAIHCPYTHIGHITAEKNLQWQQQDGTPYEGVQHGFRHF